jgi:hypothetical protein
VEAVCLFSIRRVKTPRRSGCTGKYILRVMVDNLSKAGIA